MLNRIRKPSRRVRFEKISNPAGRVQTLKKQALAEAKKWLKLYNSCLTCRHNVSQILFELGKIETKYPDVVDLKTLQNADAQFKYRGPAWETEWADWKGFIEWMEKI